MVATERGRQPMVISDRRQQLRAKAVFMAAFVEANECRTFVHLTDISPYGAGFKGVVDGRVGDAIHYRIGDDASVAARLAWIRNDRFGLEHDAFKAIEPATKMPYRSVRVPTFADCRIYREGRQSLGILRDLSHRGASLEADFEPRPGELLTIVIHGFTFENVCVRWAEKGRIGLRFDKQTGLPQLIRVLNHPIQLPLLRSDEFAERRYHAA